jgi:hypothetical protein
MLTAHRVLNFDNPREKLLLQQFMKEMLDMSFRLTFLNKDGGVGGGTRSYNLDAVWVAYVSNVTANTEDTVSHNLGRIPLGIWVGIPDKSAVVYADNEAAWSTTNIRLKASAATVTVRILVF